MKLARVGNKTSHGRACYADGGRVPEDISDAGSLPNVMGSKPDGAMGIDGGRGRKRLDRKAPSTTVNIVVASKPDQPPAPPPMPAMGGAPMPPPAPPGAMPPPGLPMRASGGRVTKKAGGGAVGRPKKRSEDEYYEEGSGQRPSWESMKALGSSLKRAFKDKPFTSTTQSQEADPTARKHGGRVMDAGAGGGLGRLEKAKDYGAKPAKGK